MTGRNWAFDDTAGLKYRKSLGVEITICVVKLHCGLSAKTFLRMAGREACYSEAYTEVSREVQIKSDPAPYGAETGICYMKHASCIFASVLRKCAVHALPGNSTGRSAGRYVDACHYEVI